MDVGCDTFCDLFAGTAIVAYAMSDEYNLVLNDIQQYSEILARCYMNDYSMINDIDETIITKQLKKVYPYRLELFEMGGKYGSSGGKGQEAALRKEIQRIIEE